MRNSLYIINGVAHLLMGAALLTNPISAVVHYALDLLPFLTPGIFVAVFWISGVFILLRIWRHYHWLLYLAFTMPMLLFSLWSIAAFLDGRVAVTAGVLGLTLYALILEQVFTTLNGHKPRG
jgi:hypothetical protein